MRIAAFAVALVTLTLGDQGLRASYQGGGVIGYVPIFAK